MAVPMGWVSRYKQRMKLRLRGRLFLVSLGLILLVGAPTGAFLETRLRHILTDQIELRLEREAALAGVALESVEQGSEIAAFDGLADRLGEASAARVTVIAADGKVLGDSSLDREQLAEVESHLRRPEIMLAAESGRGQSSRFSRTLATRMMYVAIKDPRHGFIRVAKPLSEVDQAISELRAVLMLGAGIALVLAGFISAVATQITARPLLALVERARSLSGSGDDDERDVTDAEELGYLAGSFERLAQDLNSSVSALASERDRLDAILNAMGEGIVAVAPDMRVQLINPAARKVLNCSTAAEGMLLSELCDNEGLMELAREREEPGMGELAVGLPPRNISVFCAPLDRKRGVLLVLRDVTKVRRLEAVRRDFVANISHELRTPVSVIRANSETLLAGALEDPKQGRVFVEACLRHSERLSHLLSDLLDLGRLEADAYKMSLEWIPLQPLFDLAVSSVETVAKRRGVGISVEPTQARVQADQQAIVQVLVNLLENAAKYTSEDGQIWLTAQLKSGVLRIEVRDNGPGVAPEHRPRLFERFYRADAGRSREMGGTGLGLSIVKHLVINMGGSVGMEPVEPHGSCFWFSLQGSLEDAPEQSPTAAHPAGAHSLMMKRG